MDTNALPRYDTGTNTTGCCPKFNPIGWDNQTLHFRDKPFVRALTKSAMHVPLNMGTVFTRVQEHIEDSAAFDPEQMIVLSHDLSPWEGEHFFAVTREVEDEEMVTLSGDYMTRVFEGPYSQAKDWMHDMEVAARANGKEPKTVYMFYTTCPRCAKAYGENYVVGVVEV
ncbi:hydrolase [Aestuariicoccus sp. MJ-SS9]|uniref:hydrolase n=1 Tax=Aestuariicoccus sp. MJ-SS9 TaxID=3079855 RepID=UPI00290D8513|nr:hydrolase [Aestuariicoccus sp. MJ-SS9]MDU8911620.1 hydrolase [Aestuariicoccus sp. MJ-SS9]